MDSYNEFLKAENEMLRQRVPKKHIVLKQNEKEKLMELGLALGPGIRHVITIVAYSTFVAGCVRQMGKKDLSKWGDHELPQIFANW